VLSLLSLCSIRLQKFAKHFFSKAFARGFKNNKDIINHEEIKRELMPKTKDDYKVQINEDFFKDVEQTQVNIIKVKLD